MVAPLILVEAQPRVVGTGAVVTERLAGGGGAKPYFYSDQHWRAGILGLPRVVASLSFDGEEFGGGSVPEAMQLRWQPSRSVLLKQLAAYHWNDAAITVRVGPEGLLPPVLTSGSVLSTGVEAGALVIALSDPAADLRKPILTDRFAGTGGLEGPVEWKDRIKKRGWGRLFNVPGDVIDAANNIHCFADPMRPWAEFVEVRDKGAAASPAALTVLAWQGTAAATFAALQAAAAPQGGGVLCPSIACVKWWMKPVGSLCADVRGEIGAGYVETSASIAERIAAVVSATPFAAGTVAAANLARPIVAGWLADSESGTAAAALDELLSDVSLAWLLDQGAIVLRRWEWTASVASARSVDVARRQSFKPVSKRRLGYRRNHNVMSRDAIAGIVLVDDVAFDDGEALSARLAAMVLATEALGDIASGKGRPWFQATPPSAAESGDFDTWFQTPANTIYRRVPGNGRISFGGTVVTFGGSAIVSPPWAPAQDQGIAQALAQAASAIQQAQAAQASADDAIASVEAMVDDGILSGVEKKQLKIDDGRLDAAWAILDVQAATFGITTERTAAATARTNWLALRATISPAWDDTDADSPVDRAAFLATLKAYDAALTTLQKAISAKAATTSTWDGVTGTGKDQLLADAATAKANAAASLAQISIMQSDGYINAGSEKRDLKATVDAINAEYAGIVAKAAAQFVSSSVYQAAYAALIAYLGTLSPAWNAANLDTAVVPATFNGKFTDYLFARTDLLIACADLTVANQLSWSIGSTIEIPADYTGAIAGATFPKYLNPDVKRGGADVRTDNAISYALSNWTGGCDNANTTVDNTNGSATKGRLKIDAPWNASGTVDYSVSINGVLNRTDRITVTKKLGNPPSGGGSGSGGFVKTGSEDRSGSSLNSVAPGIEVARIRNMRKAAGETIRASFNSQYLLSATTSTLRTMSGKAQWSPAGAESWTDFPDGFTNGSAATYNAISGDGAMGNLAYAKSVAPADGDYDVRLVLAISSNANFASFTLDTGLFAVTIGV